LLDQKKVTKKNQGKKILPTAQVGASRLFAGPTHRITLSFRFKRCLTLQFL
jgi:hypothetical protein